MKRLLAILLSLLLCAALLASCDDTAEPPVEPDASDTQNTLPEQEVPASPSGSGSAGSGSETQNPPEPELLTSGSYQYFVNDAGGVTIAAYTGAGGVVDIPATPDGKPVTAIGKEATLTTLTLPEGLLHIGDYAFAESPVVELTIPKSVTGVSESTFWRIRKLETLIFEGDAPTDFCRIGEIGRYTVCYHSGASGFIFPRRNGYPTRILGVEWEMPCYMDFEYEENDAGGIRILGYDGSAERVEAPAAIHGLPVTEIGMSAFDGNRTMTEIVLPETVTIIGRRAFESCEELVNLQFPRHLVTIDSEAFSFCLKLQSVILPDGLTMLGDYAFNNCWALKEASIPGSLTDLGESAFMLCARLTRSKREE